jgi:hypothetical protein
MYRHPEEVIEQAAEESMKPIVPAVTKVKVWVNHDGHDQLHMTTNIPSPYSNREGEYLVATTFVPINMGVSFCKVWFPAAVIEVESPTRIVKNIY